MGYCDYAILKHTHNDYLECTLTNTFCAFQKYCHKENCMKHTPSFTRCVARRKQMDQEKEKAENLVAEKKQPIKKESAKKKYKVILINRPKWVIYEDESGNNVKVMGDFDTKVGGHIEL